MPWTIIQLDMVVINGTCFGLLQCDVIPSKILVLPVLPDISDGKLLFCLNPTYHQTFAGVELELALQKGYKINVHSTLESQKYTGSMKDYVELFLKKKDRK